MAPSYKTPENKHTMYHVQCWSNTVCAFHRKIAGSSSPAPEALFSLFFVDCLWDGHQPSSAGVLLLNGLSSYKQQILHSSFAYKNNILPGAREWQVTSSIYQTLKTNLGLSMFGWNLVGFTFLGLLWFLITLWNVAYVKTHGGCKKADAASQEPSTQQECECMAPGIHDFRKNRQEWVWQTKNVTLNIWRDWWQSWE